MDNASVAGTVDSDILSALLDIGIEDSSIYNNRETHEEEIDEMANHDLDIDKPGIPGYGCGELDPSRDPRLKPHTEFVLEDSLYTLVQGEGEPYGYRMVHLLDESVTIRPT